MDSKNQLTKTTVALHWIIAIGMIGSIVLGIVVEEMSRGELKGVLMGLHKSVGLLVLLLALYRIFWRFLNGFPEPLRVVPAWQERIARLVHQLLLLGTVLMPVSGVLLSVGEGYSVAFFGLELIGSGPENELLEELGEGIHEGGANLIIAAIVIHVLASVKHHLFNNDGTMQRMLGKRSS